MSLNKKVAFIGAGNMAEALIRGLLATSAVAPSEIVATDIRPERLEFFTKTLGIGAARDNASAANDAEVLVLAVKPQQTSEALASLRPPPAVLFISIAAGVTTSRIERELGGRVRVIRAMPNTPALVGAGATALARGAHATNEDLATAETILGAVGLVVRVDETQMDAVTALSGSGPAYVFLVVEAMIKAGVAQGLTESLAKKLAVQTVYGATKLLMESPDEPQALRRKVTSPGGTTEAALKVMTDRKLVKTFAEAIKAAAHRSKEMSGPD
ncbi:MAG TPA: pyrroline-5-carboxylate reductase [Verrucomicrobiae bacterium]|nr:pyrroline-5-carboxylate reductase [Verrucomicrobiae bacterium]